MTTRMYIAIPQVNGKVEPGCFCKDFEEEIEKAGVAGWIKGDEIMDDTWSKASKADLLHLLSPVCNIADADGLVRGKKLEDKDSQFDFPCMKVIGKRKQDTAHLSQVAVYLHRCEYCARANVAV